MTPWNDPSLQVRKDPPLRAEYRLLQSWYRENVLELEPGEPISPSKKIVGNNLPKSAGGMNFLNDAARRAVLDRAEIRGWGGGMLNDERLHRNMLSSQPLCFNLFGQLRLHPEALRNALRATTGRDMHYVLGVRIEWAPPKKFGVLGGSSFDAVIDYVTPDGAHGFIGIETKYTEDLGAATTQLNKYIALTDTPQFGFKPDAGRNFGEDHYQIWFNALLGLTLLHPADGPPMYDEGCTLVMHLEQDAAVGEAVAAVRGARREPDEFITHTSYEQFLRSVTGAGLDDWKASFEQRYLDTTPIK